MQPDIPWLLLEKHFEKQTNNLENQQINNWLESASENNLIMEQLRNFYEENGSLPVEFTPNVKSALSKVSAKISEPKKAILSSLWWKIAAMFLLLLTGWWFVHYHKQINKPVYRSLTSTNTTVSSLKLVDGSQIWLNAGSKIKYPENFGKTRDVYLKGEAYFEIAHDPQHPFIVHTGKTKTKVLGTKFNIRSFSHEKQISIVVTQGKVSFGTGSDKEVFLTHGKKGVYDKQTGQIAQLLNTDSNFMSWKTQQFVFDSQPLENVLKTLSEVYHFTYQFENPAISKRRLTARFNQRPLSEIIETISISAEIKVTSKDNIYYIN